MKINLKLLTGRSGDDGSYSPGDKINLPIKEAIALVNSDQAVPTNKKEYEKALAMIDQTNRENAEKEAQVTAILEKEALVLDLMDLYRQVARKAAQIEGIVITDEEVEAFVEKSMNGEDPAVDDNFPAGKQKDENSLENGTEKPKDESGTENSTGTSEE
ncbi:hypothetical protein [Sulfuricurvum sp.]|uniref:hypothetical protein n=1 Tax=Sulfuricurvum sp. TaxID=2025608 RepID=UPI003BB18C5A